MTVNFPTSLDSLSNPASTDALNNSTTPHATQHANANDILEALEAKVGIDASTPSSGKVMLSTGTGHSKWGQIEAGMYGSTSIKNADVSTGIDASKINAGTFGGTTSTAYKAIMPSILFVNGSTYFGMETGSVAMSSAASAELDSRYTGWLLVQHAASGQSALFGLRGGSTPIVMAQTGSAFIASTAPSTAQYGVGLSDTPKTAVFNGTTSTASFNWYVIGARV